MSDRKLEKVASRHYGSYSDPCVYCGQVAMVWEHVIPYVYQVPTLIVRACHECNALAGSKIFDTIVHKYHYLQGRLRTRYSKFVNREEWEPEEIAELSYKLRTMVKLAERESLVIHVRLSWLLPGPVVDAYDEFMKSRARQLQEARKMELERLAEAEMAEVKLRKVAK